MFPEYLYFFLFLFSKRGSSGTLNQFNLITYIKPGMWDGCFYDSPLGFWIRCYFVLHSFRSSWHRIVIFYVFFYFITTRDKNLNFGSTKLKYITGVIVFIGLKPSIFNFFFKESWFGKKTRNWSKNITQKQRRDFMAIVLVSTVTVTWYDLMCYS